ncbi:MAG TPA: SRPBCC family protein [Candidatus Limnocylindrales bacterium]|nr:SRPBCC family protein [Candidatus Limnocylindrales bacterium]
MNARTAPEATPTQERTTMERTSERELVVTRTIDGPPHIVFDAWTKPELLKRWWVPRSVPITLLSVEMDVRVGGTYRLVFQVDSTTTMAFFGRYLEVSPPSRLVWTNEEEGDAVVTTVTFDEDEGRTRLIVHDLYPSKEALDRAIASESIPGWTEMFDQLDELLFEPDAASAG